MKTIHNSLVHIGISVLIICSIAYFHLQKKIPYLVQGPGTAIVASAENLWDAGTLSAPTFYEVDNLLTQKSSVDKKEYWQDLFVVSKKNILLPKHAPIMAILSSPIYGIFAKVGFLVFNISITLLSIWSILFLSSKLSTYPLPAISSIIICSLTQLPFYIWTFSHDLFGAFCIIGGLALSTLSPFLGGILIGASIFIRPSHLLLAIPLAFLPKLKTTRWKRSAGVLSALLIYGFIQFKTFGKFFSHWYQYIPSYKSGTRIILDHPIGFSLNTFLSSWPEKLFDLTHGLLLYNPLILMVPAALWFIWQEKISQALLQLTLIALIYCCFIFSYEMWDLSGTGSRFLLPAIFLFCIPVISAVSKLEHKRKQNNNK